MIRVTVELLPFGLEDRKRHKGTAIISNEGTGTLHRGNYTVTLYQAGDKKKVWRRGDVKDFPRRKLGSWDLLYQALRDVVGERNPQ